MKNLHRCMIKLDYYDESRDAEGKVNRLAALEKINQMFKQQSTIRSIIAPNLDELMHMIKSNIFRPLPRLRKLEEIDKIINEFMFEMAENHDPKWKYLQPVYEILLQIMYNAGEFMA